MRKTIVAIVLSVLAAGVLAQSGDPPLPLDVAQQHARHAREELIVAERKSLAARKKDKSAQERLAQAKSDAEKAAALAQEAQAEFDKAKERHDLAYGNLRRAHEALQESNKQR